MKTFLLQTYLIFKEEIRIIIRNPFWLFFGLFEPVVYLLLFMPFLNGITNSPGFPAESTSHFFIPGLMIMTAMFNSSYAGFGVLDLLESGFIERMRVTPVSRLSLALGFLSQSIAVMLIQSIIIVVIAFGFGFNPNLTGLILLLILLILIGLFLASASYSVAFLVKDGGLLASATNFFILPLFILSGIMLPIDFAPKIIRQLTLANPFTYAVEASRLLSDGHFFNNPVLIAFGSFLVLSSLTLYWFIKIMKETVS